MADLAQHGNGGPVLRQEISAVYAAQLFRHLEPATITAADVIQAVEGPVAVVHCVLPGEDEGPACNRVDRCVTHLLWRQVSEAVTRILDSVTLQDLADQAQQLFPGEA
jgi:DNA-binding IscR family transcriptional regulator